MASLRYICRGSSSEGMGWMAAASSSPPGCSTSGSKTSGVSLEYLLNSNSRSSSMGPLGDAGLPGFYQVRRMGIFCWSRYSLIPFMV